MQITAGERLRIEVRFAQPPFLVFSDATVTRVDEPVDGGWTCALRFDDLDIYIEQRIVRWVFSEQRRVAERRAAVRVPVEVPVRCEPAAGGEQFKARTIDLAGDGARIVTNRALVPGRPHPDRARGRRPAYRVACVAEVVWANTVGDRAVGVRAALPRPRPADAASDRRPRHRQPGRRARRDDALDQSQLNSEAVFVSIHPSGSSVGLNGGHAQGVGRRLCLDDGVLAWSPPPRAGPPPRS